MPAELDRCVQKVMKTGKSKSSAFAICNARLKSESTKDWKVLEFFVPIEESLQDGDSFMIRGVAINETTTLNGITYVAEELQKAAPSFRDKPILLDHKNEVMNIVGRTTENVDFNSTFNRIDFEGKIMDKNIIERIQDGRIKNVSIGAKVQDLIEEEDGSTKAIGLMGLELSIVAVPGDSHANLAQAIQQGLVLKEKAESQEQLNMEKNEMVELEKPTEVEAPEEPKEEVKAEEPKEEPKEEPEMKEEKVQKIDVKVDTTEISEMKTQIAELKELLIEKKKIKEEAEEPKEPEDETKGEVSSDAAEEKLDNIDNKIVEAMGKNFRMYHKDYSADTNLKRLVR